MYALDDGEWAAMVRFMQREAQAIERQNRQNRQNRKR